MNMIKRIQFRQKIILFTKYYRVLYLSVSTISVPEHLQIK